MRSGKRMPSSRQTEDTCELRYPTLLLEHQREYVSTIWDYRTPVALVECGAAATTNVGCSPSPKCGDRVMMRYVTVGLSVLVGVAVFEVALIPAVAIGQDDYLSHDCDRRRLYHKLFGDRRPRNRGVVDGLWLCRRSVCLSRSRNGVGLFHCAETAPVRTATDGKPRAGDQPAARRCVDSRYSGAACDRFAALQPFTPPCRKISGRGITIRRSGRVPDVGATVISLPAR